MKRLAPLLLLLLATPAHAVPDPLDLITAEVWETHYKRAFDKHGLFLMQIEWEPNVCTVYVYIVPDPKLKGAFDNFICYEAGSGESLDAAVADFFKKYLEDDDFSKCRHHNLKSGIAKPQPR